MDHAKNSQRYRSYKKRKKSVIVLICQHSLYTFTVWGGAAIITKGANGQREASWAQWRCTVGGCAGVNYGPLCFVCPKSIEYII
jgi:hypothetical protein